MSKEFTSSNQRDINRFYKDLHKLHLQGISFYQLEEYYDEIYELLDKYKKIELWINQLSHNDQLKIIEKYSELVFYLSNPNSIICNYIKSNAPELYPRIISSVKKAS